jgi:hypothetical protein
LLCNKMTSMLTHYGIEILLWWLKFANHFILFEVIHDGSKSTKHYSFSF